jgi:hypothetical protein
VVALVEAGNLDEAIELATRIPAARLSRRTHCARRPCQLRDRDQPSRSGPARSTRRRIRQRWSRRIACR